MLIKLMGLALLVVFAFCFRSVSIRYRESFNIQEAREHAEKQMAARFIRVAIEQYELRSTRPDLANAKKFEELSERQDDLVEEYYLNVEAALLAASNKKNKQKVGLYEVQL